MSTTAPTADTSSKAEPAPVSPEEASREGVAASNETAAEQTATEQTATAVEPGAPIEVDQSILNDNDNDSAYNSDDLASFTASLTSSVYNFPVENGRRYHAYSDKNYAFPNDEKENDRLDLSHHMYTTMLDGKLFLAPIGDDPKRILDLGTGTGIWCIQMGDTFPNAEILGNDLSPVQPSMVPPNVRFEVDDIESEWTYSSKFDFIHCRYMIVAISDWDKLVERCYEFTKLGGWVEFQDYILDYYSEDNTIEGTDVYNWLKLGVKSAEMIGRSPSPAKGLAERLKKAGFVDVHEKVYKIPLGPWPKDRKLKNIGAWNLLNTLEGCEGWTLRLFTQVLGWSIEEVQVLLAKVRADLRNPKLHGQHDFHIIYGRKPLSADP